MRITFFFIFFLFYLRASSQTNKAIVGLHLGYKSIVTYKSTINTRRSSKVDKYAYFFYFSPKIGFFPSKKVAIGLSFGRSFFKSNFYKDTTKYGVGYWALIYLGKYVNQERPKILPYFSINHELSNKGYTNNQFTTQKTLQYQLIYPAIGSQFRIWKYFMFDASFLIPFSIENKTWEITRSRPSINAGFFYYFTSKNKLK